MEVYIKQSNCLDMYNKYNFKNILLICFIVSVVYTINVYCNKVYFRIDDKKNYKNIRIMQYNVEYLFLNYNSDKDCPGNGCTWKSKQDVLEHLNFVSTIIKKINPDIVNLCEIQNYNSIQEILNNLDNSYSGYFVNDYQSINKQNVGLISKIKPNKIYKSNDLQLITNSNKKCDNTTNISFRKHYVAEFYLNNIDIVLIGVHLKAFFDTYSNAIKEAEIKIIRDIILSYDDNKHEFIVIGDFNDFDDDVLDIEEHKSRSNVFEILKKDCNLFNANKKIKKSNRYSDIYKDGNNITYSLLDYVLVSKQLYYKIRNIFIYNNFDLFDKYNSDHMPLVVDFELY